MAFFVHIVLFVYMEDELMVQMNVIMKEDDEDEYTGSIRTMAEFAV